MKIVACEDLEKGKIVRVGDLLIVGVKQENNEIYDLSECYIDFKNAT